MNKSELLTTQQENNLYIKPEASEQSPWAPTGKPLSSPSNLKKKRERERFIFQSSFSSQHNRAGSREFPYTPCLPHTQPPLQLASGTTLLHVLQLCDSTLTQYYTVDTSLSPKSLVYIKFHPWRCPLCGSGQMYNDLHYHIIWSSLTA